MVVTKLVVAVVAVGAAVVGAELDEVLATLVEEGRLCQGNRRPRTCASRRSAGAGGGGGGAGWVGCRGGARTGGGSSGGAPA